ncbi:MAG: redox-sensing transcriptional repressor Rex [Candidatus Omnitrophica bacterium]|nr:redox-sensing transcriptional repressor Rex [Candidatus Omnitrophota bacterium]
MQEKKKIPKSVASRLSLYLREISRLEDEGGDKVSSVELGELTGLTDAQVRKDLSYFGQFGTSGSGYEILKLKNILRDLLGKDNIWHIVLIGAGNIGSALLRYPGFKNQGFIIKEAFDIDQKKIGKCYGEVTVKDVRQINDIEKDRSIKIAIITVPVDSAQDVAEEVTRYGIICILNFSPVILKVDEGVTVRNIDLSNELENFSFILTSAKG